MLARTSRSVAVTEAGERLLNTIAPRFDEIEAELLYLSNLRAKPYSRSNEIARLTNIPN
jgi:DNA-binding transcriptional LysR family regulator